MEKSCLKIVYDFPCKLGKTFQGSRCRPRSLENFPLARLLAFIDSRQLAVSIFFVIPQNQKLSRVE